MMYNSISITVVKIKNTIAIVNKDMEQLEYLHIASGNIV